MVGTGQVELPRFGGHAVPLVSWSRVAGFSCHGEGVLELYWGEHAEAAVAALPLVDDLRVLKDVEHRHQQRQEETGDRQPAAAVHGPGLFRPGPPRSGPVGRCRQVLDGSRIPLPHVEVSLA